MTERTIEGHVMKCADEGLSIDWEQFIPTQFEPLIAEAVKEANSERLTPIKELLPDEISFFMIRAYLQKSK
jgi:ATP-dependent DNA helicase RecQ